MRFLGNIEAKADSKGRVFLPAGFRKVLQASGEDQIVMRKDVFQDCLVLYPESVWNEQVDQLRSKLNRWNKQHQQIYRQFVSDVELVNLDASGRMLIPRRYQQLVGITQDVRFLGVGDTIEIWAGGKDSKPFMDAEDFGKALEELMGEEQKPLKPLTRPSDTLSPGGEGEVS